MSSVNCKRIASEMVRVISEIIMEEARDSLLKTITITGCEVAADLSFAKVYFTSLRDMDHKDLEHEMEEASSFLRGQLSERMELRNTPKLKFLYDESIQYGEKIERILKEIKEEDSSN